MNAVDRVQGISMIVMMISLMRCMIMNTARTSALADPNVIKLFQRRVPALSATLSSDFSSRRFITDILPSDMHCPMAPCYGVQHG